MPTITKDTPRSDYTIAAKTFSIAQPYTAGATTLTDGEASALNQVLAENTRNNLAKQVKALVEAGTFDQTATQKLVDDYVGAYQFGVRTGGGGFRASDPLTSAKMDIARELVRDALKRGGHDLAKVSGKDISRLAKEAVDGTQYGDAITKAAKARLSASAGLQLNLNPTEEAAAQ